MRTVNLGILGSGLAVEYLHLPALRRLENEFQITMLCDSERQNADHIADLLGHEVAITHDWNELFTSDQVEAVLISLPIHLNAEAIRAAAAAGKHVICEKPLASNLPQAEALVHDLRHASVKILLAENYHYRHDLKQARAWLDGGEIGKPVIIATQLMLWSDTDQGFASTPWRHDHQYRGAFIADAVVHQAALMRELGGEIESVHAFVKDIHPVLNGYDSMVLNLRFKSGILGTLAVSGAVRVPDGYIERTLIVGDGGSIEIRKESMTLHKHDAEPQDYRNDDPRGFVAEFRNFYNAIVNDEPIVGTLEQALHDWRVIMRALDAAEGTQVVRV